MEQAADNKRGWKAIEWTRDDRQQQINNQPSLGVAKMVGDTAVKAKATPVVNEAFRCRLDHGGGRKVSADGRAAVDNRQQRQRQSGNNQLKVLVASAGIDSHEGSGKQWRLTAIGSKTPLAKAIVVVPPTPLSLLAAGGSRGAVAAAARE
jgi:hypothetical protein